MPAKQVFWVPPDGEKRLAIVARPGGGTDLLHDLRTMKKEGVTMVISLLEPSESRLLGLENEAQEAEKAGMRFLSFPISDRSTPSDAARFAELLQGLRQAMQQGERIGIHCWGSIGRSTVLAAALQMEEGISARLALEQIESARGYPVPDTEEQLLWILNYSPKEGQP